MTRNLTPHAVSIITYSGEMITILPEEKPARVVTVSVQLAVVDGIQIIHQKFGEVENLPEPQADLLLIVSQVVFSACGDRSDLVFPADFVRNAAGAIIACRALSK